MRTPQPREIWRFAEVHMANNGSARTKTQGFCFIFPKHLYPPTGVSQWIERQPTNQKVAGLVPSQGTRLGCGPGPPLGVCERQLIAASHISCFSPSLSPSLPLKKVNKYTFLNLHA